MTQQRNSDAFLGAFSTIERVLKKTVGETRHMTFYDLLHKTRDKNALVRKHFNELKMFGDLRNAIVHQRIDHEAIAEPHDHVVAKILDIAAKLENPPSVFPRFQTRVDLFRDSESIGKVTQHMYKHSYSQVVIVDNMGANQLLTTNTIARWVGLNAVEELVDLSGSTVKDVLAATEFTDNFRFIPKTQNCYETVELFQQAQQSGKPLDALLITERGRRSDSILGIITPYQIPDLIKTIS
ncbi:hypothetical protein [Endozoicomonas acroporae]|uniref:hypothetical protein n=1 Tax=Endozoicomonas acroporae TaxID=1701104 RepID=UPI003D795A0C